MATISSPVIPGSMSNTPASPCTTTALLSMNSLSWASTPFATCFSMSLPRLHRGWRGCGGSAPGGDDHGGSDEVESGEGGGGGGVCPREEGRDQRDREQRPCRPHESLGGASAPTTKRDGNDDAHDREDAGPHGEPGQRDRFATIGDLEVDANGLGKRSGEGGGRHRCERGKQRGDGEPTESVGVAGLARCQAGADPAV